MSKRFTETTKWSDRWYLSLSVTHKTAWQYVCDCCDHAGLIEIHEPIANMQVGAEINWQDFAEICGDRVMHLGDGKYWVRAFIRYQYGELNPDNRVHRSVIDRLASQGLEAPRKGLGSPLIKGRLSPLEGAKDKDKDKDRKLKKTVSPQTAVDDDWHFPSGWDCHDLREALDAWAAMRSRIRKPIRSKASTSKIFKRFASVSHLLEVAEFCEANEYQGLKPEYGTPATTRRAGAATFAAQRVDNSRRAIEDFANG